VRQAARTRASVTAGRTSLVLAVVSLLAGSVQVQAPDAPANYARACGSQGTSPCPVSVSASWGTESYSQVSPSVVVDGVAGSANPTLAHSDGLVANEWLMVDLQKQRSIVSVTIHNRFDGYESRLTGAEIRVGDASAFDGNPACATISTADVASRKIDKRCSVLAGVSNAGQECWLPCGEQQGICSWCGPFGMCCRYGFGDTSGGCDGTIGVQGDPRHVCAAATESVVGRCDVLPAYLRESSVCTRTVCLLLFL